MKLQRYAALNIALFAFISLNPYIRWIIPNEFFYGFFLVSTFILSLQLNSKIRGGIITNISKLLVALFLLIFIVYFTTSLVHSFRWGHFLWFIPFLMIVFYNDAIIERGYVYLRTIMVWIAIFALIVWVLKLVNFPLPYYSYIPEFRYNPADYYRIYGPAISLYRGSFAVGEFYGFERITGVFAEPGHFGIYIGLIIAIERFKFSIRRNQILFIAGIMTFSSAFYAIISLGFIYQVIMDKKVTKRILYPFVIIIFFAGLGLLAEPEGFRELTYGRTLGRLGQEKINPANIIDSRVSEMFVYEFEQFAKTPKLFTGQGMIDEGGQFVTNWRGLIFRFGIIGLSIIILLVISIAKRTHFIFALLLLSISVLIISHRSYLLYNPSIYILIFFAAIANQRLLNQ
jgi:hypothetical protein